MTTNRLDDDFTLLCERCGYVVDGLPTDGACPECGRPIAKSLPERRVGTPWQRSPTFRNLLRTWAWTLLHPMRTLDALSEVPGHDRRLRRWTTIAAALLFSLGWWQYGATNTARAGPATLLVLLVVIVLSAGVAWLVLQLLIHVETWGLGVIARVRRARMPRAARYAVTAHGCVGWVLAGFMLWVASIGLDVLHTIYFVPYTEYDPSRPITEQFDVFYGGSPPWLDLLNAAARVLSCLIGLVFSGVFAWLGMRRLKYANRARPAGTTERTAKP